jgi:ATP-dependent protease ClpP protease subunit
VKFAANKIEQMFFFKSDTADKVPFYIKAVKAQALTGPVASIRISGTIGWETSLDDFRKEVDALTAEGIEDCHIYINSPGGSCFDAEEIVNIISRFNGKVTGEGGALVASAATYIAIHCSSFIMPRNGQFMVHKPSGYFSGTTAEIESALDMLRNLERNYLETYKAKAANPKEFVKKWEAGDYWMTAQEAKNEGFITGVRSDEKVDKTTAELIKAMTHGRPNSNQIKGCNMNEIIALMLGLPKDATEDQIKAKIEELKEMAGNAEMVQTELAAIRDQQIIAAVEAGIAAKKFTADRKQHFVELGKKIGVEGLKTTIDAMQTAVKPTDVTGNGKGDAAKMWSELGPQEKAELREKNPEGYAKLFEAEYGFKPDLK